MSLNFTKLVPQGRAKDIETPWTAEELDALITLEKERCIVRVNAADYIRNGILTLEDYDKAVENDFVPLTLDEIRENALDEAKKRTKELLAKRETDAKKAKEELKEQLAERKKAKEKKLKEKVNSKKTSKPKKKDD